MKLDRTLLAAMALATAAALATPTLAASTASCREELTHDADGNIVSSVDANADTIIAGLRGKGIDAVDVQGWGGCVRADVRLPDGRTTTQFFDPQTLQRLTPAG